MENEKLRNMTLFTGHLGELIEVPVVCSPPLCVIPPPPPFDGADVKHNSSESPPPQIMVTNASLTVEEYKKETSFLPSPLSTVSEISPPSTPVSQQSRSSSQPLRTANNNKTSNSTLSLPRRSSRRSISDNTETSGTISDIRVFSMSYNEYGELVDRDASLHPSKSAARLGVTETLRLIDQAYHYEFTAKMRDIVATHVEYEAKNASSDAVTLQQHSSAWKLVITSPIDMIQSSTSSETSPNVKVSQGPTRVLEIGCTDGEWCFKMKDDHPDWIIEGLDTKDGWSKLRPGINFRDFIEFTGTEENVEYFGASHSVSKEPEFTVRNINNILDHATPIPHYRYSFIRGRDIFSCVESWRSFLNDVRLILQPDGVVEFMEIDPRPRVHVLLPSFNTHDRKSGPMFDWGDDIASRFKTPADLEIDNGCPEWNQRVNERQKATVRPFDGVPAAELKSWLQGTGFWDVKEVILHLPIGGNTEAGKLLLKEMIHQIELENQIPLLAEKLPRLDLEALVTQTQYFINIHIVTGRKPKSPRPGDLLLDGSRQDMTASKYETMARYNNAKSNQWMRYENDKKLDAMMKGLSTLHTGPSELIAHPKKDDGENYSLTSTPAETAPSSTIGSPRGLGPIGAKNEGISD